MELCARWLARHCNQIGLKTKVYFTPGHPVVIAQTPRSKSNRKPHFIVYGHYDVQPPEPLELWKTPPFEPCIKNGKLYARGASDNKGSHFAHLKAVEAYLKTGTALPCDLTFVIEGEEEISSTTLATFLKKHQADLRCDAVIVSDTVIPSLKHPALTHGLRGLASIEIKIFGPSRDLHSGIYGGSVANPAIVLCQILAQLHDLHGRIAVPHFYDRVDTLPQSERKRLARIPFYSTVYQKFLGVPKLFGEKGYNPIEHRSIRPTLEINGLTSGYQGEGTKTIIPSWASAKITCRLVPNQNSKQITQLLCQHLRRICPSTVRMKINVSCGSEPYLVSANHPQAQAALRALKIAFDHEPVLTREGASIPIVADFKSILGVDTLLVGLTLPDDNLHSPNEKFDLECFARGMWMSANLWQELTR